MKRSEMLQLVKLRGKAKALSMEQDKLVAQALAITGEENEAGYTFDFILNDFGTVNELLTKLNIEVE